MKKYYFSAVLAIAFASAFVKAQAPLTLYVDANSASPGAGTGSQAAPFKKLEDLFLQIGAQTAAQPPPSQITVNIAAATYTAASRQEIKNLPFPLTIIGANSATTIVKCSLDKTGHLLISQNNANKISISKVTFSDCNSSTNPPVTVDGATDLTLQDVIVSNNVLSGGIVSKGTSKLTLNAVKLNENTPAAGGVCNGVAVLEQSSATATDLEVGSPLATAFGTGIVVDSTGKFVGSNLYIYNARNNGFLNGGAISINQATVTISNSRFINNYAINGGALYISGPAQVDIRDTEFRGQFANRGGNVFALQTSNWSCTNCYMWETTGASGGYFFLRDYSQTTLRNVTLQGNYTMITSEGSSVLYATDFAKLNAFDLKVDALFGKSGTFHLENKVVVTLTRLKASNTQNFGWGGLFRTGTIGPTLNILDSYIYNITHVTANVFTLQGGTVIVQNTTINGALTNPGGGGSLVQSINSDSNIYFIDCNITNIVSNTWAVLLIAGGNVYFDRCTIQYVANTNFGSSLLYLAFGMVSYNNSYIIDGGYSPLYKAQGKDGFMHAESELHIENTVIARNTFGSNYGVIDAGGNLYLTVKNVTFEQNISDEASSILIPTGFAGTMIVTDSKFIRNKVNKRGGAILINALNPSAKIIMQRNTFIGNQALLGGAIYSGNQNIIVKCEQCDFENNTALIGGAAIFNQFYEGRIDAAGAIFKGNTARYGPDMATEPTELTVSGLYTGNSISLYSGQILKNFTVMVVDHYKQRYMTNFQAETVPTGNLIVDKFAVVGGNATLSGDVSALCWEGICDNLQLKFLGNPGNYTLTLSALVSAGFSALANFKLSVPLEIQTCPTTDGEHVLKQVSGEPFPSCVIPFCPGCINGKCNADEVCECYSTWHGPDCSQRYPYQRSDALKTALSVIAVISMVFSVCLGLIFTWQRNYPAVRKASAKFIILMCFGAATCYATILITKESVGLCLGQLWLKYMGFCMIFGSILVKSYRIHVIFKSTRKVAVNDAKLLIICAGLTSIFVAFLIIWSVADQPTIGLDGVSSGNFSYQYCIPPRSSAIGLVIQVLYYATGIYFAISTRNVAAEFNEAKTTGASIYIWAFIDVLIQILLLVVNLDPDSAYILESVGMLVINWVAVSLILIPKLISIIQGKKGTSAPTSLAGTATTKGVLGTGTTSIQQTKTHLNKSEPPQTYSPTCTQIAAHLSKVQKLGKLVINGKADELSYSPVIFVEGIGVVSVKLVVTGPGGCMSMLEDSGVVQLPSIHEGGTFISHGNIDLEKENNGRNAEIEKARESGASLLPILCDLSCRRRLQTLQKIVRARFGALQSSNENLPENQPLKFHIAKIKRTKTVEVIMIVGVREDTTTIRRMMSRISRNFGGRKKKFLKSLSTGTPTPVILLKGNVKIFILKRRRIVNPDKLLSGKLSGKVHSSTYERDCDYTKKCFYWRYAIVGCTLGTWVEFLFRFSENYVWELANRASEEERPDIIRQILRGWSKKEERIKLKNTIADQTLSAFISLSSSFPSLEAVEDLALAARFIGLVLSLVRTIPETEIERYHLSDLLMILIQLNDDTLLSECAKPMQIQNPRRKIDLPS
ncbi:hypothetical protein HK098_007066 [Nowakowskiella sp. JEL0407]|nr:hypothetical protein HK098_007066 [Nowakowskiella sp. JEL0407]